MMKKFRPNTNSCVKTVRQEGGECLEKVLQQVRVVREESCDDGVQIIEYVDPAEVEKMRLDERREVAEARCLEAQRRAHHDQWLEEKMMREEKERRESVKLMEMLRTARLVNRKHEPNNTDKNQVDRVDNQYDDITMISDREDTTHQDVVDHESTSSESIVDKSKQVRKKVIIDPVHHQIREQTSSRIAINNPPVRRRVTIPSRSTNKPLVQGNHSDRPTIPPPQSRTTDPAAPSSARSGLSSIDEVTESLSRDVRTAASLSTIDEVTEVTSVTQRLEQFRRLELSDTSSRSMSPFPQSEVTTARENNLENMEFPDLEAVKRLIERVKKQGERLNITDQPLNISKQSSSRDKLEETNIRDKYQVNQDFLKKVLDFSSSLSTLSSDESSFRPVALPLSKSKIQKKTKSVPAIVPSFFQHSSKLSPILKKSSKTEEDGSVLREYIVKLLQMKHEDIAELSVTSDDASRDKSGDANLTSQRLHWSKIQISSDNSDSNTFSSSTS